MLTIEQSPKHVLAIRLSGTVGKQDVEMMEKAFSEKLAANDRLGLLVDMSGWSDMTGDAIVEDMKFEFGLLGKLGRFPRMAIVSDKQFVEAIMKFLDPLVPMVSIARFGAEEFDAALAFASDLPPAKAAGKPAVTLIDTCNPMLIAYEIDGVLTTQDIERLVQLLQTRFEKKGKVDLLARIKNYAGFDPSMFAQQSFVSMKLSAIAHVRRYAVVGAPGWMQSVAGMVASILPIDIRFFNIDQEGDAWTWLKS